MSEPTKAVFLSYASQDAEAAKRIADALRAAGVEVWFDAEGGLEHGDEWDAKIRRQIKECVLFIAVISANTQAREEGYFRIEWELAAQRALGIASGVAFILPVVIDGTREPGALVPDRFRSVQWTRLPGGNVPSEVLQRFLKLWSHRAGMLKQASGESPVAGVADPGRARHDESPGSATPATVKRSRRLVGAVVVMIAIVAAYLIFKPRRSPEEIAKIVGDAQKLAAAVSPPSPAAPPVSAVGQIEQTAAIAVTPARDWPKNPELKRVTTLLDRVDNIPEDFRLAEQIAQQALAKAPTDAETVTVMARVHSMWLLRGWDRSTARYQQAKATAERALQLAPDEPEAHAALAMQLYTRGSELPRALELAQRAVDLAPQEPRFHRLRDNCLFSQGFNPADRFSDYSVERANPVLEKALESSRRTVGLFPRDALVRYELARHYRDLGRWAEFERLTEETLTLAPVANALVWKARGRFGLHGDLAGMKAVLDQVPARLRTIERTVFGYFLYAAYTGDTRVGLDALDGMTESWMIDFDYRGPKALPVGALLELAGKKELARVQYEAALAELLRARAASPEDALTYLVEAWIQLGLGKKEAARAALRVFNESVTRPYTVSPMGTWWFQPIPANLLMGERATALTLIREATANYAEGRATIRQRLASDPRLAPFRDDPEITALLAEPNGKAEAVAPPRVDEKSVAVLAFANLSDDKANEYFSDGISEELLNVLAKVPGLKVTARTSSFHFKGKDTPVPEIAQQLGVAYVVEGSVRKAGDKVRITAQLIKAADDFHVWSDTFTRDLKDIFAVQDEIAGLIAQNLQLKLGMSAQAGQTASPEAHQLYLQGKYFLNRATLEDTAHATALLQRAVELDPSFAQAWAALSGAGWFRGGYGLNRQDFDEGFALARRAADQAVAIEPALAAGHIARLDIQSGIDFDWKGAKESLRRAQALTPNDVAVIFRAAQLAYSFGQMERATELIRQTVALDPVNPLVYTNEGYILLALHRFDEAEAAFRRVQELSPASPWGHAGVAMALVANGRNEQAAIEAARETNEWSRLYTLSLARWGQKDRPAADKVLAEFIAANADVAAYQIASAYAYRGEADRAFEWLERAYRQRDPGLGWAKEDFFLQGLHADPRWPVFMKKLGVAGEQLP